MKLRRLPETDLANIAPLSRDQKRIMLRSFNSGGGSWSYDPARNQNFNIVNPANPLGLHSPAPSIDKIRKMVADASHCEIQKRSCLEVVELFYEWYGKSSTMAVERRIRPLPIGTLGLVQYCESFIALIDGRPTAIFLDYRRQKGLSRIGRKFAFSMMDQQIRVGDPDFPDARLLALAFPQNKQHPRRIVDYFDDGIDLYTLPELIALIEETYQIWFEVLNERRAEPPKRASGGLI
jgi:hypothetical protein